MDKKQKDFGTARIPVELLTFLSQVLFMLHSPGTNNISFHPAIQEEAIR